MTVATAPSWRRVARAACRTARRVHRRLARASVILLYHRVTDGIADPWSLCVSPANFRAQMRVLATRDPRPLGRLAADTTHGGRGPQVAVTFDDGYADFRTTALPLLQEYGVPATLFVVTGTPADPAEFWWDALERAILAPPVGPDTLDLEVRNALVSWRDDGGDRRGLYGTLHRLLGALPGPERQPYLESLAAWAGVPVDVRPTHRPLRADDVVAVASAAGIEVGAHGVHHSFLSALDAVEQVREIRGSRRWLEEALGRPIEQFSYPHGDHTPMTVDLVRTAGYRLACTSTPAPVMGRPDPLTLPRVEVPDLDGPAFARWLDGWMG